MSSHTFENSNPNIFGYLYIAVFSNGTVKAGMSAKSPQSRVAAHSNSGKAFDVRMDSAFYASIYTDDIREREKLMHKDLALLARNTAGKEWFKFDDAFTALNFASAYCCKVERMSFSERPSMEAILKKREAAGKWYGSIFEACTRRTFHTATRVTAEELEELGKVLSECSDDAVINIAKKITDFEDCLAQQDAEFCSGLTILIDAINRNWHAFLSELENPNDLKSRSSAMEKMCANREASERIVIAAANYPYFFHEALNIKWTTA